MYYLFSKPKSKEEQLHHANIAIVQGATGLVATSIGFALLSPGLAPAISLGIAIALVMLIIIGIASLISCTTGILDRQDALGSPIFHV